MFFFSTAVVVGGVGFCRVLIFFRLSLSDRARSEHLVKPTDNGQQLLSVSVNDVILN